MNTNRPAFSFESASPGLVIESASTGLVFESTATGQEFSFTHNALVFESTNNPGPEGPPGPPGPPGAEGTTEIVTVSFAFGDAAHAYYTIPIAARIVAASITYRTAFNGTNPVVVVGVGVSDDSILSASDSDPKTVEVYSALCDVIMVSDGEVWITITPDGATQGTGVLTFYLSFT